MKGDSLFSTRSPAFIICRSFDDGHSDQCEVILHYIVLICSSPIISDVQHHFMFLLAIHTSSLQRAFLFTFVKITHENDFNFALNVINH